MTIETKVCRCTGKPVWRVLWDRAARPHVTQWTTYRGEAEAWAAIIARHGWCTSAGCGPHPDAYATLGRRAA
jgi:hypothetical protein